MTHINPVDCHALKWENVLLLDVIEEQMNVDGEKQTDAVKRAAVCRECLSVTL